VKFQSSLDEFLAGVADLAALHALLLGSSGRQPRPLLLPSSHRPSSASWLLELATVVANSRRVAQSRCLQQPPQQPAPTGGGAVTQPALKGGPGGRARCQRVRSTGLVFAVAAKVLGAAAALENGWAAPSKSIWLSRPVCRNRFNCCVRAVTLLDAAALEMMARPHYIARPCAVSIQRAIAGGLRSRWPVMMSAGFKGSIRQCGNKLAGPAVLIKCRISHHVRKAFHPRVFRVLQ
jgi:hypothetical protein